MLKAILSSNEIKLTENWDLVELHGDHDLLWDNFNPGDSIEYIPSWSEYNLSDLDRQMYGKGFRYKKIIVMKNDEAVELTNELVPITVDTATPIGTGKMRSDCGDIRFYWWNESTQTWEEIGYWIDDDTVNTANTRIILRIPSVSVGGYVNIVMYYGAMHYGRKDDLTIAFGNRNKTGKVLRFDGVDDYVTVDRAVNGSFTLVWIGRIKSDVGRQYIFENGNDTAYATTSDGTWAYYYNGTMSFHIVEKGVEKRAVSYVFDKINQNIMIACVYDEQSTTMKLYENAILKTSRNDAILTPSARTKISFAAYNSGQVHLSNEDIYTVILYNRALSDIEIQQIYDNPNDPPRAGLVLWLAPDSVDDANGIWKDKSGLGNDGTIVGATPVEYRTFETTVQTNKVMSFDGVDDYVKVQFEDFGGWDGVTVVTVATDDREIDDTYHLQYIFKFDGVLECDFRSGNSADPTRIYYHLEYWTNGTKKWTYGAYNIRRKHRWYFVAFQLDFKNGGSYVWQNLNKYSLGGDVPSAGTQWDSRSGTAYIGSGLKGKIAKLIIYNRVLSDMEIQQIYNNPNNPPLDGLVLWLDGTSIDEQNGKWLNKVPVLKTGYVAPLDGVINGATPITLLDITHSDEIDMNKGIRITWKGVVKKKVNACNNCHVWIETENLTNIRG